MFHISFLVHDKHLADVLRGVADRVINLEVRHAKLKDESPTEAKSQKVRSNKATSAAIKEAITNLKMSKEEFTQKDLVLEGFAQGSVHGALKRAVESGEVVVIKDGGRRRYRRPYQSDRLPEGDLKNAS